MSKEIGKKGYLHKILTHLLNLFSSRKTIIFDAPFAFHLHHLLPVINKLIEINEYKIIIISPEKNKILAPNIKFYQSLPIYVQGDIFITTEFGRKPYWLDAKTIYFGHGIGPKFNYLANDELLNFDFLYSPCLPIYNVQKKVISTDKIIKVGLPIIEKTPPDKANFLKYFNFLDTKKTIIYAPSWCDNTNMISDIQKILIFLNNQEDVNIIISPHPLLLDPYKCNGKTVFKNIPSNLIINPPNSPYSTFDLISLSDGLISDISSVLFEGMALDKVSFFDGNEQIYEYYEASAVLQSLLKACPIPNWEKQDNKYLINTLNQDKHRDARSEFIHSYLFNVKTASIVFINHLKELIK